MIEIYIFKGERKEHQGNVKLRPQGKRFVIERGKWTPVHISCLYALQDSVVSKMVRIRPEETGRPIVPNTIQSVWVENDIPRFHYQWREIQEQESIAAAEEAEDLSEELEPVQ